MNTLECSWTDKKFYGKWGFYTHIEGTPERREPNPSDVRDIDEVNSEIFANALDSIRNQGRELFFDNIDGIRRTRYVLGDIDALYESRNNDGLEFIHLASNSITELLRFAKRIKLYKPIPQ